MSKAKKSAPKKPQDPHRREDTGRDTAWCYYAVMKNGGEKMSLAEIGRRVGASPKSIYKWRKDDKWDDRLKTVREGHPDPGRPGARPRGQTHGSRMMQRLRTRIGGMGTGEAAEEIHAVRMDLDRRSMMYLEEAQQLTIAQIFRRLIDTQYAVAMEGWELLSGKLGWSTLSGKLGEAEGMLIIELTDQALFMKALSDVQNSMVNTVKLMADIQQLPAMKLEHELQMQMKRAELKLTEAKAAAMDAVAKGELAPILWENMPQPHRRLNAENEAHDPEENNGPDSD